MVSPSDQFGGTPSNLIFSIKHVNHDFVRALDFNTTLGHGKHQQIVEVSVNQAGLYGRCSSPYYIGKGIIEGWEEMQQPKGLRDLLDDEKIKGVWIWCWGDGWVGPYFSNELWNDISEYVLRKWTMDPEKSEEFYFNEYATETLGLNNQQLKDFRKLVMLATDATFLGQQSRIVPVSDWWCRDHYLTAFHVSHQVKKGKAQECIAEKVQAVEMWKEAEKLAAGITLKNPRDTDFMRVSTTYGRIKYQVIEQLWRIQMMLAEEQINKKPLDENAARAAVQSRCGSLRKVLRRMASAETRQPLLPDPLCRPRGQAYGRTFPDGPSAVEETARDELTEAIFE